MTDTFAPTDRTTPTRLRDRASYERATAYAILDEAYYCHLGFVVDGEPRVLPTLHVRVGDALYLHGSTGARALLAARRPKGCRSASPSPTSTASSWPGPSSTTAPTTAARWPTAGPIWSPNEQRKRAVLTALVDKIAAGRAADSRPPTRRELAETAVLDLPLTEVSVKARVGGVNDDEADLGLDHWAGVVPMRLQPGIPEPAPGVTAPVPGVPGRPRGGAGVTWRSPHRLTRELGGRRPGRHGG